VRPAQGTIFCEDHVPAEAVPPPIPPAGPPREEPSPYTAAVPPRIPNPEVSPGIAFGLGFIPGVGAIYNGQYAKGLVHAIVIGLIISVMNSGAYGLEPMMAFLLVGFWIYMAFEAFHTAKKRLMGEPVDEFSSLIPMHGGTSKIPMVPVLLILLGIVFLLNNLEIFELRRLARYWPVILIVLGAYMLFARFSAAARARGDKG
jgi:hypothetical protein